MTFHTRTTCRLCPGELRTLLELAPTPPANALLKTIGAVANRFWSDPPETFYPLGLAQCVQCGHVQNPHVVDPSLLFTDDYAYVSGTSAVFRQHLSDLARSVSSKLFPEDLIVEVGSNDGTLLSSFMTGRKLGVDPARKLAEKATKAGVLTYPGFLTPETAHAIVQAAGKARRVLALNVLAHIADIDGMAAAIWGLLADDGELILEVGYLPEVVRTNNYPALYHEHLDVWALGPMVAFWWKHGMSLYDAHRVDTQGGSIRCFVSKERREKNPRLAALLANERDYLQSNLDTWPRRVQETRTALRDAIMALKEAGHSIAGYGAAAKATTLLHSSGLGREHIDRVYDLNPLKVGRFLPGNHIPVVAASQLEKDQPDYCLMLSGNFSESIRGQHPEYYGKWLEPLPMPVVT